MKSFIIISFMFLSFIVKAQEKTIIQLKVPNKDDVVYIAGNQSSLGNWDYDKLKMYKVSDFYRMIAVKLEYPAEFKFTRGSLDTEGIHKTLKDNPNFILNDTLSKVAYRINAWKDELLKSQMSIGFQYLPFQSKVMDEERTVKVYLPKNYSDQRRYPVIYLTEASEEKFKIVTSNLESLSMPPYNAIPECILVGIEQDNVQMEINTELESSAEQFKKFILSELVTLIDSKFNTSGFNAIIGHDMGADFNQMLMMSDYNPIKGYININPNLNDNLKSELEDYFQNYDDRQIFYYLSSAAYGDPQEKESFDYITNLNQPSKNSKIDFSSEEFKSGNGSLFSASIKDGLLHVFNRYRNLNEYTDFKDYAKNYLYDMILTYRINAKLEQSDVNYYASKIIEEKNVEAYEEMISTLDKLTSANPDQKVNLTTIDKARHYFKMGWTEKSLEYWNLALNSYSNDNSRVVDPKDFYNNFTVALEAYQNNENTTAAISFLEKSIKVLPQYALEFNYYIARLASKNPSLKSKGQASLLYCVEAFEPNIYFTKDDMKQLVYAYDE